MKRDPGHLAYLTLVGTLGATAVVWLLVGLVPAVAAVLPGLHDWLHEVGDGTGPAAEIARNAGRATHNAQSIGHVVLDYLFSGLNLGLGLLLVRLRGHDRTARLLALGMIGTAIAFNLQGHDALQVLPASALGVTDFWHALVHILSGLAYLFALLLFPDGRLLDPKGPFRFIKVPLVVLLAWVFLGFSLVTVDDHTFGLVLTFGIAIPIAGVTAQIGRYRRARDETTRRQSRVLLWTLVLAFVVAVPLTLVTSALDPAERSQTVSYEVAIDRPGNYFFRCDPHPDDMVGVVEVTAAEADAPPSIVVISARDNRFDENRIRLAAGRTTTIRFTSFDAELHNVAIYRTTAADDPQFIGKEFSGRTQAVLAFRVFRIVFALMAISLLIALIRFRLWDVERVINRTLLYGVLLVFITAVYLGIVIGIGALVGAGARLNVVLSVVVTVLVAAAFQPLRERARALANRLVYGRRASPYDVLAELAERMAGSFDVEEVIPRLARTLAEGTAARRAEVWLRVGDHIVLAGCHPDDGSVGEAARPLERGQLPPWDGPDRVTPVLHSGELLGAFTLTKPPGESFTPVEDRLVSDVASQAGMALKNAQLTTELQARLKELRASRQRIVRAQDEERRRLERNIHDGAQQHIVGMSLKLRLAEELAEKDPAGARAVLAELQADAETTLQTLRDLARGIYPPILADRGLVAALEAHARRCSVEVRIESNGIGRLDDETENAVYFCCLEAIQNAIKHTGRGPIIVSLQLRDGWLDFAVGDRGPGFDSPSETGSGLQNMADRIAALGGTLTVSSRRGGTTTVSGRVPP